MNRDDELEVLRARLTERSERCAALEAKVRELEHAKASLEEFAYIVSHDLQEPLRVVASYMQLVETHPGKPLDDERQRFVDHARKAAERAQDLVRDLLQYARMGEVGPRHALDMNVMFANTCEALELSIRDHGATVIATQLPWVYGDPQQIACVLRNLIGNALKYKGRMPPRILLDAVPHGGMYMFTLEDNGIGIAARHHERIFRIFQRLHPREAFEGTGIGLALCKRIVEAHGGQIGVHSQEGGGSTFWFTLPAVQI